MIQNNVNSESEFIDSKCSDLDQSIISCNLLSTDTVCWGDSEQCEIKVVGNIEKFKDYISEIEESGLKFSIILVDYRLGFDDCVKIKKISIEGMMFLLDDNKYLILPDFSECVDPATKQINYIINVDNMFFDLAETIVDIYRLKKCLIVSKKISNNP